MKTNRRFLFFTCSLIFFLGINVCHVQAQFSGGDGSVATPYLIGNIGDLKTFRDNVNSGLSSYAGKYFKLMADIDLNNESWTPIGYAKYSVSEMHPFSGSFDGNGKTISNFLISGDWNCIGFFGYIEAGSTLSGYIKNLHLRNGEIRATPTGTSDIGSIVGRVEYGYSTNDPGAMYTIEGCTSNVLVICNYSGWDEVCVGGICGRAIGGRNYSMGPGYGAVIINKCVYAGSVTGGMLVGGICGYAEATDKATITQCVNNGTIMGDAYVGGICGRGATTGGTPQPIVTISNNANNGNVIRNLDYSYTSYLGGIVGHLYASNNAGVIVHETNYNYAPVTAEYGAEKGGIVGFFDDSNGATLTVANASYYLQDIDINDGLDGVGQNGVGGNGGAWAGKMLPLNIEAFKNSSSFIGWDFTNTWEYRSGIDGRPYPKGVDVVSGVASVYYVDDIAMLKTFLDQSSAIEGKKNMNLLWKGTNPIPTDWLTNDGADWAGLVDGITWEVTPYGQRIQHIDWGGEYVPDPGIYVGYLAGTIDLNQLDNLITFGCSDHQLTALYAANLTQLVNLSCTNNKLTVLEVPLSVTHLSCNGNRLTSLDVSNFGNLTYLDFSHNYLTTIDMSNFGNLVHFDCSYNKIPMETAYDIYNTVPGGCLYVYMDRQNPDYGDLATNLSVPIDLTAIGNLGNGSQTRFWLEKYHTIVTLEEGKDFTTNGNIITIDEPGDYYLCMANPSITSYDNLYFNVDHGEVKFERIAHIQVGTKITCTITDEAGNILSGGLSLYPVVDVSGHLVGGMPWMTDGVIYNLARPGKYWVQGFAWGNMTNERYTPGYYNADDTPSLVNWEDALIVELPATNEQLHRHFDIRLSEMPPLGQETTQKIVINGALGMNEVSGAEKTSIKATMARPVAYATVILYGKSKSKSVTKSTSSDPYEGYDLIAQTQTDKDGNFKFEQMSKGYQYLLRVEMPGYTMEAYVALDSDGDQLFNLYYIADMASQLIIGGLSESPSSAHTTDVIPVLIYPNPATDIVRIVVDTDVPYIVRIFNGLGQQLITGNSVSRETSLDVSKLKQGIYFIKIESGGKTGVYKLMKR